MGMYVGGAVWVVRWWGNRLWGLVCVVEGQDVIANADVSELIKTHARVGYSEENRKISALVLTKSSCPLRSPGYGSFRKLPWVMVECSPYG